MSDMVKEKLTVAEVYEAIRTARYSVADFDNWVEDTKQELRIEIISKSQQQLLKILAVQLEEHYRQSRIKANLWSTDFDLLKK